MLIFLSFLDNCMYNVIIKSQSSYGRERKGMYYSKELLLRFKDSSFFVFTVCDLLLRFPVTVLLPFSNKDLSRASSLIMDQINLLSGKRELKHTYSLEI